jgi:hypothetical protein
VFELIHPDVGRSFQKESYSSSKYLLTVIDNLSYFIWVFSLQQKSDTSIAVRA